MTGMTLASTWCSRRKTMTSNDDYITRTCPNCEQKTAIHKNIYASQCLRCKHLNEYHDVPEPKFRLGQMVTYAYPPKKGKKMRKGSTFPVGKMYNTLGTWSYTWVDGTRQISVWEQELEHGAIQKKLF